VHANRKEWAGGGWVTKLKRKGLVDRKEKKGSLIAGHNRRGFCTLHLREDALHERGPWDARHLETPQWEEKIAPSKRILKQERVPRSGTDAPQDGTSGGEGEKRRAGKVRREGGG